MSNPEQAEGVARGQSIYFSFSTPNGVELLSSSDKEDIFLPRAALRLREVTHIECLPAFLKITILCVGYRKKILTDCRTYMCTPKAFPSHNFIPCEI
ncbi:MAG: hypothetical protein LBL13_05460 [Bacteroidales bacterium]|nr:hypothetical protein [Bacteroidales bacterium]